MARFHVYEDGSCEFERRYRWRLLDENGQMMAESTQSFLSPDGCARDAARFRIVAAGATIGAGRHRFRARIPAPRTPLARLH